MPRPRDLHARPLEQSSARDRRAPSVTPSRSSTNFLPDDVWRALLARVLASEAQFQPSGTHDARADYRHSLVMNPPPDLVRPVVDRVRARDAAGVARCCAFHRSSVGIVEAQVTASVDGSFFGVHTDADHEKVPKRYLTYVYYFNRQPKAIFRRRAARLPRHVAQPQAGARAKRST